MTQYSTDSQMFTYVPIGPFATVYNTKCTQSAIVRHKTLAISG